MSRKRTTSPGGGRQVGRASPAAATPHGPGRSGGLRSWVPTILAGVGLVAVVSVYAVMSVAGGEPGGIAQAPVGSFPVPTGGTPAPWEYDAANNRHWHAGHGHWHEGPPPVLDGASAGSGTSPSEAPASPAPLPQTGPGSQSSPAEASAPWETPAPWEYDAANNRHWHAEHGHWHDGPPPEDPGPP